MDINMKKILYFMSALMLMVSCGDDKGGQHTGLTLEQKLCTEWHSTTLSLDADIYISFAENNTFELYQQIVEGAYRLYRGTWNLEEDILTGKYNDGEDWAAAYQISIEGETLTMTSKNDAAEVSVYKKAEIPATVKETSETIVKSL
jgi:hypothetical protein